MLNKFSLCILLLILSSDSFRSDHCSAVCQQEACEARILTCPVGGLKYIPENLPPNTTKVLLSNHIFDRHQLSKSNFSNYRLFRITKLTLINCSIVKIEPHTFTSLTQLQTLDLSKNNIKFIEPYTFSKLNLSFLRLDGNKNIELRKNSFRGLQVKDLSLNDCDLNDLNYESFRDLIDSLQRLTLTQNNLRIIDSKFTGLFRSLIKLELSNNPLDCSCGMKWLSGILSKQVTQKDKTFESSYARCASPLKLTDELIHILNDSNYACSIPSFVSIDLFIISNDNVKLICAIAGNDNSQIMWHYFENELYKIVPNSISWFNNSTINVERKYQTDKYLCSAHNVNGNSTIEIRIKWMNTSTGNANKKLPRSTFNEDFFFQRQFSLIEMIGGVVGTCTGTLLLFLMINQYFIEKNRKESQIKIFDETDLYDEIEKNPHQPYYVIDVNQTIPAHYVDFPNQQLVNNPEIV